VRILFLDQSGSLGGAQLCLADIAAVYKKNSMVCLFSDGPFRDLLVKRGVSVEVLPGAGMNIRREGGFIDGVKQLKEVLRLGRIVGGYGKNFNLIYANTQRALVVGAAARLWCHAPMVFHLHDILSEDHFSKSNVKVAVSLCNMSTARVIANSYATTEAFVRSGGRAQHVDTIYNGFDTSQYVCTTAELEKHRAHLNLDGKFVVGHFSRLSPWKGQHVLVQALALCDSRIAGVFVGDALFGESDYKRKLADEVRRLGLEGRVHFLGFRSDTIPLMKSCDLVAHTSTAPEPFGRVIVEAMLCGTPIIASNSGAGPELIEQNVTGWLVPPNDPVALAARISALVEDAPLRTRMSQQARAFAVNRFDFEAIKHKVDRLLQDVCTSERPRQLSATHS